MTDSDNTKRLHQATAATIRPPGLLTEWYAMTDSDNTRRLHQATASSNYILLSARIIDGVIYND